MCTLLFWRSNRSLLNLVDLKTVDALEYRYKASNLFYFSQTSVRFPDILVVGVKKCGTGAIIEQLGIHPQVSSPYYTIQVEAAREDERLSELDICRKTSTTIGIGSTIKE